MVAVGLRCVCCDGYAVHSGGKVPGRSDKSAMAAGTNVDEDPDEDVARNTTECMSNATTCGGSITTLTRRRATGTSTVAALL